MTYSASLSLVSLNLAERLCVGGGLRRCRCRVAGCAVSRPEKRTDDLRWVNSGLATEDGLLAVLLSLGMLLVVAVPVGWTFSFASSPRSNAATSGVQTAFSCVVGDWEKDGASGGLVIEEENACVCDKVFSSIAAAAACCRSLHRSRLVRAFFPAYGSATSSEEISLCRFYPLSLRRVKFLSILAVTAVLGVSYSAQAFGTMVFSSTPTTDSTCTESIRMSTSGRLPYTKSLMKCQWEKRTGLVTPVPSPSYGNQVKPMG